jgi:hypothetical protein
MGVADGLAVGLAVAVGGCVPTPATGLVEVGGFVAGGVTGWATGLGCGEGLGKTGGSEADGAATTPPVVGLVGNCG